MFTKRNDPVHIAAKHLTSSSKTRISVVCDYCGNEYSAEYWTVLDGRKVIQKDACYKCGRKKASEATIERHREKSFNRVKSILSENDYTIVSSETEFAGMTKRVKYMCPLHGEQEAIADNIVHGHFCRACSYDARGKKTAIKKDVVRETIEKSGDNKWINPDEYVDSTSRCLNIRCSCGNVFTTSYANYTRANINRCHSCACKESSGEAAIKEYLESRNVDYVREKRFNDCRDQKPLPFDFYLPGQNVCIEFDGKQHYDKTIRPKSFETIRRHDAIKTEYCQNNNIELIRIPYFEGHKIQEILDEIINCR